MKGDVPTLAGRCPSSAASRLAVASVAYLSLAAYGSLVPLHWRSRPLAEAWGHFAAMPWYRPTFDSRSDWAVNILLFVPLGCLAAGAVRGARPDLGKAVACLLVAILAAVAALAIEFAQEFFPPRNPSQNDVIGLTLGAVTGSALWLAAGPWVVSWWGRSPVARDVRDRLGTILPIYLALFLATQLLPLDLATSPAELARKYREGRIRPLPLSGLGADPWALASKAVDVSVGFVPLGWLLAKRRGAGTGGPPGGVATALGLGLCLAGGVEFAQVFVLSRHADATDVLVGGLAFALGWWAGRGPRPVDASPRWPSRAPALAAWALAASTSAWQPFRLDHGPSAGWGRLRGMFAAPFADYQSGNEFHALDQALHKGMLFAILGVILASTGTRARPVRPAVAAGLAALTATLLESGQAMLPGRYPSITDVLVEVVGCWAGAEATCRAIAARGLGPPKGSWTWTR